MNPEGKVLLQLRGKHELLYPNQWTLPGGRVEEGESPELAIVREVKEELGLDLHGFKIFRIIVENMPDEVVERHIYGSNISEKIEALKLGEGTALRYFSSKEISRLEVAFDLKPVIIDFLKIGASKNL